MFRDPLIVATSSASSIHKTALCTELWECQFYKDLHMKPAFIAYDLSSAANVLKVSFAF